MCYLTCRRQIRCITFIPGVKVSPSTVVGTSIFSVSTTDKESAQLYYNMTCLPSTCPFKIFACKYNGKILFCAHKCLSLSLSLSLSLIVASKLFLCMVVHSVFVTDFCNCCYKISAGAVLTESSVINVTEPGFDLYIYVSDGKNLVGPKVLTVQMKGRI